jgi:hypothetical protein
LHRPAGSFLFDRARYGEAHWLRSPGDKMFRLVDLGAVAIGIAR